MLLQFAVFLSLIMLVEVAVAIAGYVFRDKVSGGGPGEPWLGLLGDSGAWIPLSTTCLPYS